MNTISCIKNCTNCGSCVNACPANAIRVETENLFYQITIDEMQCIRCGKCLEVCPVDNRITESRIRSAWWGTHKNAAVVQTSSSGGAFSAMAECVLSKGGIVYGACMDEKGVVRICSTDHVDLEKLKRSKYVESLTGDSFQAVERHLQNGRLVLYCAAPCQIAGLKCYLRKAYPNLYTCDFACGGLSSHKLFAEYLDHLGKLFQSEVETVNFRPKTYGWSTHAIKVQFQNGKSYIKSAVLDDYFSGFIVKHVNTRENCYDCCFAEHHMSDVVLADFWKYEQLTGQKNSDKGTSLILVNSAKGEELLRLLQQNMNLHPAGVEEASYILKKRVYDSEYMELREKYLQCCEEQGMTAARKVINAPCGWKAAYIQARHILKGIKYRLQ